ncbi:MAG: hypothetical protein LBG60_17705 [Bifidobacteriaceae bacterium]|jgi:hypothetical protein|nr:hypothetical protein [Bifidobacteriaceae bacterium]
MSNRSRQTNLTGAAALGVAGAVLVALGTASAAWSASAEATPTVLTVRDRLAPAVDEADGAAAGNVTWGVQPAGPDGPDGRAAFDYQVAPGTVITDAIAVTNHSDYAAQFRVYAADATTDYDTAQFTLIGAEQASTDLGAWTAVDSGPAECPDSNDEAEEECAHDLGVRVSLESGEQRIVPFVITVPADATPGDHSAGLVASFEQTSPDESGTLVLLEQRVGARVYLRVDGPLSAAVGVSGVTATYDGVLNPFGRGVASVSFDVSNTGNVRLSGAPMVELTGPFGISLGTVALEPVANLLPGGTGHVTATLPQVAPLFLVSAQVTVAPLPGDGDVEAIDLAAGAATGSARAWAVPWSLLGLLALIGFGGWLVVWRRKRSRRLLAAELALYTEELRAGFAAGAGGVAGAAGASR